jgi:hypothetical protein
MKIIHVRDSQPETIFVPSEESLDEEMRESHSPLCVFTQCDTSPLTSTSCSDTLTIAGLENTPSFRHVTQLLSPQFNSTDRLQINGL